MSSYYAAWQAARAVQSEAYIVLFLAALPAAALVGRGWFEHICLSFAYVFAFDVLLSTGAPPLWAVITLVLTVFAAVYYSLYLSMVAWLERAKGEYKWAQKFVK